MLMKKKVLTMAIAAFLVSALPADATPMTMFMGVAEQIEEQAPVMALEGNSVNVSGATGLMLEIFSLTGRVVALYRIETPAQCIELNLPKGCYILKVGKTVRKITVR